MNPAANRKWNAVFFNKGMPFQFRWYSKQRYFSKGSREIRRFVSPGRAPIDRTFYAANSKSLHTFSLVILLRVSSIEGGVMEIN